MTRVQIVHGGADKYIKDYSTLLKASKKQLTIPWACGKKTEAGDTLLIYFQHPHSAITALAKARRSARPSKYWRYITELEDIRMLPVEITLAEIREMFPKWPWTKQPRAIQYLDRQKSTALLHRVGVEAEELSRDLTICGGGFGSTEQNRRVERAACKAVTAHFQKKGYTVTSREKEKPGYDFDVSRNGKIMHVEVKGVSGLLPKFPITANEIKCARLDKAFRLAVVNAALTNPRVDVFTGAKFLKRFELTPIAFFACSALKE